MARHIAHRLMISLPVLLGVLLREKPTRALVFVNTRRGVHFVAERLERHGYRAGVLVGDVDQKKRIRTLREFMDGTINILVATDVASRGLHIEAVSHVFNYDLPQDPEDYVHRIGRTARAGASGKAFSLACEHHVYSLEAIQEFIGMPVPHAFPEADLLKMPRPLPRPPRIETVDAFDGEVAASPVVEGEGLAAAGEEVGAPKRKRRRRRRRRGAGAPTEAAGATTKGPAAKTKDASTDVAGEPG